MLLCIPFLIAWPEDTIVVMSRLREPWRRGKVGYARVM
jgi:hypothetical protein